MIIDWQSFISAFLGAFFGAVLVYTAVLRNITCQKRSPSEKRKRSLIAPSYIMAVVFLIGALTGVYLLMSGVER